MVEMVDTQNLTQSSDTRVAISHGAATVSGTMGRDTHTDIAAISVIVNGEHALLDYGTVMSATRDVHNRTW
jgi:hypothetical protein